MKKWDKKKALAVCRAAFLFSLVFLLVSCLDWILEKPTFIIREIILSPRNFTEMDLRIGLEAQNPNRFDLTLRSFEYTVYLNREEVGGGRMEKEVRIPSLSVTRLEIPLVAKFRNFSGSLKAIITGEDLPYRIEGKADVKTVFGSLHFPFSKEGRINLKG